MKINKKSITFLVVTILIFIIAGQASTYVGPILCTIWFVIVISHYGMKGGLVLAVFMTIFTIIGFDTTSSAGRSLLLIGNIIYYCISIGIGLPIDLMRKEQAKRIASEEHLRRITDNIQDVIIQLDKNGIIKFISPSCFKHFGNTPDFYIGKSFYSELYPDDYKEVVNTIEAAFANNGFKPIEYRYRYKGYRFVWIESVGQVIKGDKTEKAEIVINCRDITERKKTEDRINYLTFHDTLTDLYNRTYFEEALEKLLEKKVLPLSIIIGDVNGLKLTNDVFGHYQGDHLLINIANILKKACRKKDIIARWGGDEFVILLPETDKDQALRIIENIQSNCSNYSDRPIKISIALGTATRETDEEEMKDIITIAEERMYRHKLLENKSARSNIVASLKKTLFERNYETKEHADRMMEIGQMLGKEIGLSENEQDELNLLAILHDIGKIAIKDSILGKPDKLTEQEWEEMKKHPEIGYRIAQSTKELHHIADYILSHHERWDGNGYPQGLKADSIPKLSRILSIIDAYDVMTHTRPYKDPISPVKAIEEIKRCSGTQFDPEITTVFVKMIEKQSLAEFN